MRRRAPRMREVRLPGTEGLADVVDGPISSPATVEYSSSEAVRKMTGISGAVSRAAAHTANPLPWASVTSSSAMSKSSAASAAHAPSWVAHDRTAKPSPSKRSVSASTMA